MRYTIVSSPVGELTLVASDIGLAAILWEGDRPSRVRARPTERADEHPVVCETRRQLGDYFAGTRTVFDLPLDVLGTAFQKRVRTRTTVKSRCVFATESNARRRCGKRWQPDLDRRVLPSRHR